jgi:NADPH-dependent 2,4-dienoyl-CoA reductase/sulfur reductase-like enzyme
MSGSECFDGGYDLDTGIEIAKQFDGHADLIHVSAGQYTGPYAFADMFIATHPSMFQEDGCNVKYAAEIKKHVNTPVATVGALADPECLEEILASGRADVVEMARALICDPDLPGKARAGREDEIRRCMRCMTCFSNIMNTWQLCCALNPEIGRELEFSTGPLPARKKTILVAGGGIAGMQTALTAAGRGHKVILCEKTDRLGGVLLCEEGVPFKKHLAEYIDLTARLVRRADIDLRMETEVTPALARELRPDVVIAALGSRPAVPDIPGIDGANVAAAEDVFKDAGRAGKKVVILGAGFSGSECAIPLLRAGKDVILIDMIPKRTFEMFSMGSQVWLSIQRLHRELGAQYIFGAKVSEITPEGVKYTDRDGAAGFVACDTVVNALGLRVDGDKVGELLLTAPESYAIGDCLDSDMTIDNAVFTGFCYAMEL